MPTPLGHALAGAILYEGLPAEKRRRHELFIAILIFALLPDIDFLFGFLVGDANLYHHFFTHSFFFVILVGILAGAVYAKWRRKSALIYSAILASAGISHVILDILAVDKRAPFGCPLFWPFSQKYYISPVLLFSDVSRVSDSRFFFQSLFNWHNLRTIGIEALVLTPVLLFMIWREEKKRAKSE